jgi:hypothetical protein
MADQSDIEAALASLATDTLYPAGASAPSVVGSLCRIYRGWPNAAALNTDLAQGNLTVTIHPGDSFRITTRHIDPPLPLAPVAPTLTITTDATGATVAGTAAIGQVAGLLVDNEAFVHRVAAGDTPGLVASILASYIRTIRPVTVSGTTITIPGARLIIGRVVADQQTQTVTRRQAQEFRLSCWCPDPASRDSTAALLDTAFSTQAFITLPDGTSARLRLVRSHNFDQSQNANLYRRDLVFDVEYATTVTTMLPALIFGDTNITPNGTLAQTLLG